MKKLLGLMALAVVAFLAACGSGSDEGNPDTLVMGFVPSQDSETIADTVEPLAEELGNILDKEVEPRTMTSYNGVIEGMGSGQVHIGLIPAFGYVMAHQDYDVEVILKSVRHGSETYKAQYLVQEDSDIESLDDLEGKSWVYGDAASTSGFLFPASQLMDKYDLESQADLTSEFFSEANAVGAHDTAALEVYEGGADVATTFDDVRDNLEEDYPDIKDKTRVLDYTEEIPNDTVSVISELDDELVSDIREAFLSFNEDEEMLQVMNDVYTWDAIVEAEHEDYQVVEDTYERFQDSISLE
ncbi:phosphate/phosphite/phosphonate ABC transporter substrate-binding protein [Alkalibacillus salilacus]|uniref:Phosphonate transport system substrate-binding protein n=1 Tax=Alkalibacillus salilacus TaxID=284582 RepID=A0ABT9VH78_9BACI|nr:phosphate/phosphite/phosphonate ABC transporter substrate-binding protein [Alkalibacillus salilacus]MDQ0160312.1 phosphonate transport system substrate-binding protein [Alkalibacillus salilacus]